MEPATISQSVSYAVNDLAIGTVISQLALIDNVPTKFRESSDNWRNAARTALYRLAQQGHVRRAATSGEGIYWRINSHPWPERPKTQLVRSTTTTGLAALSEAAKHKTWSSQTDLVIRVHFEAGDHFTSRDVIDRLTPQEWRNNPVASQNVSARLNYLEDLGYLARDGKVPSEGAKKDRVNWLVLEVPPESSKSGRNVIPSRKKTQRKTARERTTPQQKTVVSTSTTLKGLVDAALELAAQLESFDPDGIVGDISSEALSAELARRLSK